MQLQLDMKVGGFVYVNKLEMKISKLLTPRIIFIKIALIQNITIYQTTLKKQ